MAIAADGRFCGYVSGGCVESAVAMEALQALEDGRDRMVKFGEGSPFFDIVLPCGGGITIAIHVLRDSGALRQALRSLAIRQPVALRYTPRKAVLTLSGTVPSRAGWQGDDFLAVRRPATRVVISGQTSEAMAVTRLAEASGYDVVNYTAAIYAMEQRPHRSVQRRRSAAPRPRPRGTGAAPRLELSSFLYRCTWKQAHAHEAVGTAD